MFWECFESGCVRDVLLCFTDVLAMLLECFNDAFTSERGGAERRILVPGCDGGGGSAGEPCLFLVSCCFLVLVPGGSRPAGAS